MVVFSKLISKGQGTLRVISMNVRGTVRNPAKLRLLVAQLRLLKWDVVCIQEHHIPLSADCAALAVRLAGHGAHHIFTKGTGDRDGVITISKFPIISSKNESFFDPTMQGCWAKATIAAPGGNVEILNTYAPRDIRQRQAFFLKLPTLGTNAIHVGDHNCTMDSKLDRQNCKTAGGGGSLELAMHNAFYELTDAFRHLHRNEVHWTWYTKDRTKGTYVDRTFISDALIPHLVKCNAVDMSLKGLKLDHKCTFVDLDLQCDDTIRERRFVWQDSVTSLDNLLQTLNTTFDDESKSFDQCMADVVRAATSEQDFQSTRMQKAKAKITAEINKIDTQIMYETEPYDSAMKR